MLVEQIVETNLIINPVVINRQQHNEYLYILKPIKLNVAT